MLEWSFKGTNFFYVKSNFYLILIQVTLFY